jgi:hypothetical protein
MKYLNIGHLQGGGGFCGVSVLISVDNFGFADKKADCGAEGEKGTSYFLGC